MIQTGQPKATKRRKHDAADAALPERYSAVRFEEIDVDITLEQERRRNYGATPFRMEEQISDAEWTDI